MYNGKHDFNVDDVIWLGIHKYVVVDIISDVTIMAQGLK